jgi:hypothetical protein
MDKVIGTGRKRIAPCDDRIFWIETPVCVLVFGKRKGSRESVTGFVDTGEPGDIDNGINPRAFNPIFWQADFRGQRRRRTISFKGGL